jgi:hypothetical protein
MTAVTDDSHERRQTVLPAPDFRGRAQTMLDEQQPAARPEDPIGFGEG